MKSWAEPKKKRIICISDLMEDSTAVCNPYYGNVRKVNPQGASEQTDTANPFVLITIYKASLPDIRIMPGAPQGRPGAYKIPRCPHQARLSVSPRRPRATSKKENRKKPTPFPILIFENERRRSCQRSRDLWNRST